MNVSICLLIILSEVIMNLHNCFEDPKKSLLKSSHPKNTCQIFQTKNILELKFQTQKILLSSLTHENLENPLLGLYLCLILSAWDFVEYSHCKIISPSKISLKHDTMNWSIWSTCNLHLKKFIKVNWPLKYTEALTLFSTG